jgi:hypothetical protein
MKENDYFKKLVSSSLLLFFKIYDTSRGGKKLKYDIKLSNTQKEIVNKLKVYGYCKIDNYFALDKCHRICNEIDILIDNNHPKIIVDEQQSDHRLNGINNISDEINSFTNDEFILDIARTLSNREELPRFTLGALLKYKKGNLGSGAGWHRDSLGFQFKAMIYLSDVTEKTGAFQYYSKSHRKFYKFINYVKDLSKGFADLVRYSDSKIKTLNAKELVTFIAPAGTLILFNSSGIHRGSPINDGSRYALTNYYFNKPWGKNWDKILINK